MKPENFLLSSKAEDAPLKGCDFGLSVFYRPGEVFQDIVGSAYYVAPEVRTWFWSICRELTSVAGFIPYWRQQFVARFGQTCTAAHVFQTC